MFPVQKVLKRIEERLARWEKYWVPYSELSEEVKELDRIWARKVIERT